MPLLVPATLVLAVRMLLAAAGAVPAQEANQASAPPSVLFVLVDDLRWDVAAAPVETPHLERLAREGARFSHAFVTTSLCSPSRASILTGLYAHAHGVVSNERLTLDPALPTFPGLLQQAGYRTGFFGKWHIGRGQPAHPGFETWRTLRGQGSYANPHVRGIGELERVEGYVTDVLTDLAVDWLGEPDERPFCLYLSHKAVHSPFTPAERHRGTLPRELVVAPSTALDDLYGRPEIIRRLGFFGSLRSDFEASLHRAVPERLPPVVWPHAERLASYWETLRAVDDSLGRLLATLERDGRLDRTVVMLTSDNGFLFGEHRQIDKRLAYEESIRIPLFVRYPPRIAPGTVVDEFVLNVDVAPTLLELAGVEPDPGMHGRSFAPLFDGPVADWRDAWFYEYFRETKLWQFPAVLALRTARWKYIVYPEEEVPSEELYDLAADPLERVNLARDPDRAAELVRLRERLQAAREAVGGRPEGAGLESVSSPGVRR